MHAALNLGTPKSSSASSSTMASSPASSSPGSGTGPSTSIATSTTPVLAHSMSDMILSNAPSVTGFHTLHPFYPSGPGIRPGSGQYISIPTAPSPQASAVASNKRPSVSATTIAKPTPIQAGQQYPSKVSTFVKNHPSHQQTSKNMTVPSTTNKTIMIMTSSAGHGLHPTTASTSQAANFPPGPSVIKQPSSRPSQQTHHQLQHQQGTLHSNQQPQNYPQGKSKVYINTPPDGNQDSLQPVFFATHPTIQGMISVPYQTMIQPSPNHPASSTLTELLAPSGAVVSSSLREGGKGKVHDVGMRPYSPHSSNRHGPTGNKSHYN